MRLDTKEPTLIKSAILAFCFLFFGGCGPKMMTQEQIFERQVTNRNYLLSNYDIVASGSTNTYLSELSQKIASALAPIATNTALKLFILKTNTPLAVSIGTGEIFISQGMVKLLESEAELAFIISHELGHDVIDHHSDDLSMSDKEISADLFALETIVRAGYPARASLSALIGTYGTEKFLHDGEIHSTMSDQNLTHPSLRARLESLQVRISQNPTFKEDEGKALPNRRFTSFKQLID